MGTDMRDRIRQKSGEEWLEETKLEERSEQVQEKNSSEEEVNKNITVVNYLRDRGKEAEEISSYMVSRIACGLSSARPDLELICLLDIWIQSN